MTAGQWLLVLAYVALAVGAGALAIRALGVRSSLVSGNWAASFLAGQLVILTLTLSTGFGPWTIRACLWCLVAAVVLGIAIVAWRWRGDVTIRRTTLREIGSIGLAFVLFPNLVAWVSVTPLIRWDGRSIWFFHGKALLHDGGVDPAFFTNQLYWWSNLDYPLLLPAQAAWSSLILGEWDDVATRAFLLFLFAAWFRVALGIFTARGQPWWFALGWTVVLLLQELPAITPGQVHVSGLADTHYALPLVLALLALTIDAARRPLALVVLLLAYAANMKNEGAAYVVLVAGSGVVWTLWRAWRANELAGWRRTLLDERRLVVAALALGLLPLVLWAWFKARHGITGGLHLTERLTTPGLFADMLRERSTVVAERMLAHYEMLGTPVLLVAWAAIGGIRALLRSRFPLVRRDRHLQLAILLFFATCNGLVFVTYVLTPHDVVYHMNTSVGRLLYLPHLLLLASTILWSEPLCRAMSRAARRR